VVVELKTAARGAQAAQALARAGADGYTITYGTSGTYVNARFLFKNLAFDVLKDFAPISLAVSSPQLRRGPCVGAREFAAGADRLREAQSRQARVLIERGRIGVSPRG